MDDTMIKYEDNDQFSSLTSHYHSTVAESTYNDAENPFPDFDVREVSIESFLAITRKLMMDERSEAAANSLVKIEAEYQPTSSFFQANNIFGSKMQTSSMLVKKLSQNRNDKSSRGCLDEYEVHKRKVVVMDKYWKYSVGVSSETDSTANEEEKDNVKIEETSEVSQEDDVTIKSGYGKQRSRQNPKKNIPGLILQRVNRSCFDYLNRKTRVVSSGKVIQTEYVGPILKEYNSEESEKLISFIRIYNRDCKTWAAVEKFLKSDKELGQVILRVADAFLSEAGEIDFKSWLNTGKMKERSRKEITDSKEQLRKGFYELMTRMQYH